MKKTENYAMPYPEQDDYFNVEDFQDMMVSVDNLMKKLSDSGTQISSDAEHLYNQTKAQMDNIQKRMNTFTALKDGSTTGDAELKDIRVAYDGKEYGNAGEAVREQASDIHKALFGAGASIWSKTKSESTKYVAETKGISILNERFTAAGVVTKISRGTFAENESTLNLDRECSAYIVEFEKTPGTVYMPSAETIKIVSTTKITFEANGNARCWIPVEKGQYLAVDSTATAYTSESNHVPYMLYDQATETLEYRGFVSTGSTASADPYSLALEYKLEYDMDDTGLVKQIDANREAADSLKEDMGNIPIGVTDIVDNMVDSDKLKYKYTNGSWKHIDKTVTLDAGNYMFVLYNSVLSSYGYICIYKDKINGTQILRKTTDGKYNFTLTEQTTLIISMQVSGAESVTEGTYQTYYSIYNIDSVIIPKELTGVNAVENKVNAVENKVNPITDCIIKNLIDFDAITYNSSEKYTGCFINDSGAVTANKYSSSYCVTDYMNIDKKGLSINYSVGNVYVAFYDVNKKYISASSIMLNTDNIYVPYVDGAVYARFTLNQNNMKYKQYCIVEGDKSYTLAPDECVFTEELKSKLSGLTSLSAVPPERLVIQKGKQSVLYMENMIKNTNILPKSASQTIMTNIGNMAYVTPSSDVADKSITYHFRDCLGRTVDETKNYSVVSAPSKDTLNVLCVGDSFTDIGTYVGTIKDDIEEDGITVNQIGNMGVSGKRHEARSGGTWDFVTTRQGRAIIVDVTGVSNLPITGYPGTTYQDENGFKWSVRGVVIGSTGNGKLILGNFNVDSNYGGSSSGTMTDADTAADAIPTSGTLTKTSNASTGTTSSGDNTISYSDVEKVYYNPFWNPMSDELDFNYYINKWGYNSPDIVVFSIGYNDVGASKYHTVESLASIVAKAKISVDRMHADYPDAKIVLNVNPLGYGGDTSNEISESMRSNNQVTYYEALINEFGESTDYVGYVEVCPSFMFVDRIDAYGSKTVTIGRRISKTITTAGDVTHCNTVGMNQIGDAIVPYIYYLVKQKLQYAL